MATSLKTDFASGFVVLLPLLVCLYVLFRVYSWVAGFPLVWRLAPQIPVLSDLSSQFAQVVFNLALTIVLLFAIGYLMRTAVGTLLESWVDDTINRLPGFRMIYNASKVAVETAVDDVEVQEPVRLELWGNLRLTGFRTGRKTPDGRAIIFVPTSPNVTSGIVVEVDEADIESSNESIESALGRIISAGFGESNNGNGKGTDSSQAQTRQETQSSEGT